MSEHDNDSKGSDDLSPDALRAELDADRQRIAELEAENAALAAARTTRVRARHRRPRRRRTTSGLRSSSWSGWCSLRSRSWRCS